MCGSGDFVYVGACPKGFTINFLEYTAPKSGKVIGSGSETWMQQVNPGEPVHINFKISASDSLLNKFPNLAVGPSQFTCNN